MAWKITHDHISEESWGEESRVGYYEEHGRIPTEAVLIGLESPALPITEKRVKFRLYDDDGELYYEGELHDDDECLNQQAALKWGEADAGCTTIKVLRNGKWTLEIA